MLKTLDKQDFDKMYEILARSFPLDEYRSYEDHKALLDDPHYTVYTCCDGEDLMGFLAVWEFEAFGFIEHFAVAPRYRNRGLGGRMLKDLAERLAKQLCLEVEPPQTSMACRRIGFYQRNGFYLNDYAYTQPSLGVGRKEIPLRIMTSGSPVDQQTFERIREVLYSNVYNRG